MTKFKSCGGREHTTYDLTIFSEYLICSLIQFIDQIVLIFSSERREQILLSHKEGELLFWSDVRQFGVNSVSTIVHHYIFKPAVRMNFFYFIFFI